MTGKKVVIIGAGAAGLVAAAESAKRGNDTLLLERMPRPGRKIMITGKGRCNVTNACFDIDDLISNIVHNPRFMYSAFSAFMPYDTIALLEEMGVPVKIERGNRVFPVSDKAVDVVDALVGYAKSNGAVISHGRAQSFRLDDGKISAVVLDDGSEIECDAVAICTGGASYPATGSTGDGYRLAKSTGHKIIDISPSLVPIVLSNNFVPRLQGLSLKNVSIHLYDGDREVYHDFGEMLFTHYGVSGPIILSASCHISKMQDNPLRILLDLKPALDEKTLDKRIQRDFAENNNKDFINSLSKLLPSKIIPVIVALSGIEPGTKVNQITKEERYHLVKVIKGIRLDVLGLRPIEEAIVTSGGVDVKEIDPKTMRSKLIDNLYFAGEVIDVDAYTGGFNLQIAFSTGFVCGNNI